MSHGIRRRSELTAWCEQPTAGAKAHQAGYSGGTTEVVPFPSSKSCGAGELASPQR
jgi:hypothetical protein